VGEWASGRVGEWASGRVGVLVLVGGRPWFLGAQRSGGEPLAADLLICYLIRRLPGGGVRTEDICGYLPPPPLFLKP